jgi:hypothetical protein
MTIDAKEPLDPRVETADGRRLRIFALIVIGSVVLALASMTTADPDLWGHVRFGLDIIRDGDVHARDPYSFTADRPWVNHEWLAEVLFAAAYAGLGPGGLVLLKVVLVLSAGVLMFRTLRIGASEHQSRMLMLIVVAALMPMAQSVRPQLFSILGFAAVLGELTMCAVVAPVAFSAAPLERLRIAAAVVAAVLAPAVNPYGLALIGFLMETLRVARPDITEWGPVFGAGVDSIALWLWITSVAAYWCYRGFWRRHGAYAVTLLVFAILSFQVVRLVGFFALVTVACCPSMARTRAAADQRPVRLSAERLVLAVGLCASLGSPCGTGAACACRATGFPTRPTPVTFNARCRKGAC